MGRGKVAIQLITDKKSRRLTFQNRKKSLFKKAYELSVLCDVDVCVIVNDVQNADQSTNEPATWPENLDEVRRIIARYKAKDSKRQCKATSNNQLQSVDSQLNCFSDEQLFELLNAIDRKLAVADNRLNTLLTMQTHQLSIIDQYSGQQLIDPTSSFQYDYGNSGFDWINGDSETTTGILADEMLLDLPLQLPDYPLAVTPLQTYLPPLLPHPSMQSMPVLHAPPYTPRPDYFDGDYNQMLDDSYLYHLYPESFSAMNDCCNSEEDPEKSGQNKRGRGRENRSLRRRRVGRR